MADADEAPPTECRAVLWLDARLPVGQVYGPWLPAEPDTGSSLADYCADAAGGSALPEPFEDEDGDFWYLAAGVVLAATLEYRDAVPADQARAAGLGVEEEG